MASGPLAPSAQPSQASDVSADELRSCVRDLVGLFALPGVWRRLSPRGVLVHLLEVIEAALPVVFFHVRFSAEQTTLEIVRADGREIDDPGSAWRRVADPARAAPQGAAVEAPGGPLHTTHVPFGLQGIRGAIVFGSRDAGFPTVTQAVVLRAATSLADAALDTSRLLEQREQALRSKDEFLAMLGHELRNPLAPIATAVQLMRMRAGGGPQRELDVIERQVAHLLRLVDDLLDVARVTRGKIELRREAVEATHVLAKALETASPWLDRAGHRLETEVEPQIVLDVDPTRAAQVLANLLTNAAKYTPAGGRVRVAIRRTARMAAIAVSDNGLGIAPELQAGVFEMFSQGTRSADRSQGGLGIGLALVRSLVELHGGEATVASDGPGRGSTFTVTFPLASVAPGVAERTPPAADAALAGYRLLLVDDNVDAAALLADVLRARGAVVTVAHDSLDAIEAAVDVLPHVALLDIGLPVMDGYELGEALRRRLGAAAPRIFALTGYGQDADRARSREAKFAGHLVKPVDPEALVAAIAGAEAPGSPSLPGGPIRRAADAGDRR